MTGRKYTTKFRTKVVPEALKERSSVAEPAQKYAVAPPQISLWKRDFLANADTLFAKKGKSKQSSQADEEKDQLLKAIGQLKPLGSSPTMWQVKV